MSDADMVRDPEGAAANEPAGTPTDPVPPFDPVPPTEPMPADAMAPQAQATTAAAEATTAEATTAEAGALVPDSVVMTPDDAAPAEPPGPPPPSAEELAAIAASAPVPTAEEMAALAAAAEEALPLVAHDPFATPDTTPTAAAEPAKPTDARRRRLRGWGLKLVTSLFSLALFVGGVALGSAAYQRVQPPAPVVGDPSTGGVPTPPVVKELADALKSNNADSLRSAVSGDPYRLLTGELQSWDLQGVTSVETLATMQDGPRSATEIVITGKAPNGDPRVFNLVVHVNDNQIVNFR